MRGVNPLLRLLAVAAFTLVGLVALLPKSPRFQPAPLGEEGLAVCCAAALRTPVEAAAKRYQRDTGVRVQLQYGGSNTLLSQIEISRQGDLFLAADQSYLQTAKEKELVTEIVPLANMRLVLGVPRGNPLGIHTLQDLAGRRVAIGNPDQAAVGLVLKAVLSESGRWEAFYQHVRQRGVTKPTVADVANDLLLGSVDAGVLWDAVAAQHPGIQALEAPELAAGTAQVAVGVLNSARNKQAALRFARYLASPGKGQAAFTNYGYSPPHAQGVSLQQQPDGPHHE